MSLFCLEQPWFSRIFRTVCVAAAVTGLTACAVGPDYQRPDIAVGTEYGALGPDAAGSDATDSDALNPGWVRAQPRDDHLRSDWWIVFDDPTLDQMMENLLDTNFDLARAEALYRQAQATLQATRSGLFPTLGTSASATRAGSGQGGGGGGDIGFSGGGVTNQYSLSGTVSWEADVWGRIRRSVEADRASADASAADLASTRLSLQSTLAQSYFRLWAFDAEAVLLGRTVEAYERSLNMTRNRLEAGVATPAEVAVSTTQLENARAQLQGLVWQRSQLEHDLATLQGLAPSTFALSVDAELPVTLPEIPVGVPAQLLQRRPDVAAAERRVQQANASIGVAQAAWFPDLTLTAQGGYRSGQWAQWLTAPAQFWSLGPALALTIFDAGGRSARVEQARAAYDAQAASYRQSVLTALREVEDVLVQLDSLSKEAEIQDRALRAARESLALTRNQYDAGMIDYLSVVQVETTALNAERAALSLKASRLLASVQLIAALGGGWDTAELRD